MYVCIQCAGWMRAGWMCSTFLCGEPAPHSGLEYILQCFYGSMCFHNESVFTEVFLKCIKGKRRGKDSFRGLSVVLHWPVYMVWIIFSDFFLSISVSKQNVLACLSNGISLLVMAEILFAVSQAYRSPLPAT